MNKVFVYIEMQVSAPFDQMPWPAINERMLQVPGMLSKTWLHGLNSHSNGAFYEFDSLENAQTFAWEIFPLEARGAGVSFTTKLFDGDVVAEASRAMRSPYYLEQPRASR